MSPNVFTAESDRGLNILSSCQKSPVSECGDIKQNADNWGRSLALLQEHDRREYKYLTERQATQNVGHFLIHWMGVGWG